MMILLYISPVCFAVDHSFKPDSLINQSTIKSLSDEEYQKLKTGAFTKMADIADVNHFPSPHVVLKLSKELSLTTEQLKKIKIIIEKQDFKTREMGVYLLKQEQKLNDLFASGKVNEGAIIYHTNKIGLYHGELRNAYLQANYQAKKILTLLQIKKYEQINGY